LTALPLPLPAFLQQLHNSTVQQFNSLTTSGDWRHYFRFNKVRGLKEFLNIFPKKLGVVKYVIYL